MQLEKNGGNRSHIVSKLSDMLIWQDKCQDDLQSEK